MNGPWALFGVALSAALVIATPFVWRARGAVVGLRWFAVALVPGALAMTGLFTLFARVTTAVSNFFALSVFSPLVWSGYVLLAVAVLIWFVAGAVKSRRSGREPATTEAGAPAVGRSPASIGGSKPGAGGDDEFADIEAILRRRGI